MPGEKLQKLRRLALAHPRPKGERNPSTRAMLDRARPQHNIKESRVPLVGGLTLRSPFARFERRSASRREKERRFAGLRALARVHHGMGVVVHGELRLSNCSIANKSAAQLESASSYTRGSG